MMTLAEEVRYHWRRLLHILGKRRLCDGAQDEHGPVCQGEDVRLVLAREYPEGELFAAHWCADCRRTAKESGYEYWEVK